MKSKRIVNGMESKSIRIIVAATVLLAGSAFAQEKQRSGVYKWTAPDGTIHFSKTLPPEVREMAHEKIGKSGGVIEKVGRALTEEELIQLAKDEALAEEERQKILDQMKKDHALLTSYPSEEALEDKLNYNLERTEGMIVIAQKSITTQLKGLSQEVSRAANIQRAGIVVDDKTRQNIAVMQVAIQQREKEILDLRASQAAMVKRHEFDKKRYNQLKANNESD